VSLSTDIDALISHLARPLHPADAAAFRTAAMAAAEHVPYPGPGSLYRAIAALQRSYFDPPPDGRQANSGARHYGNKLSELPPIGADDVRVGGRDRHRLKAVG
jgi:hypothetical protein